MKRFISIILFFVFIVSSINAQQRIVIKDKNNKIESLPVWKIDEVSFQYENDSIYVLYIDSLRNIPVDSINSIYFEKEISKLEQPVSPQQIDMGLSVYWADINLGARTSSEKGFLVGWSDVTGEIHSTQDKFYPRLTPPENIMSTVFDLATSLLGTDWHTPSNVEIQELIDNCTWKKTVSGYVATSKKTERKLFFPFTGYREGEEEQDVNNGYYWSSYANIKSKTFDAYYMTWVDKETPTVETLSRHCGLAIRPVCTIPNNAVRFWAKDATEIDYTSAKLSYDHINSAGSYVFFYSEKEIVKADISDKNLKNIEPSQGKKEITLTDLNSNQDYWYFVYVKKNSKIYTSEIKHFKTKYVDLTINIFEPDSAAIDLTKAAIPIEILGDKNLININSVSSDLDEIWVMYSETKDFASDKTITKRLDKTKNTIELKDLSTYQTYYCKVYANAKDKTIESNVISFKTKSANLGIAVSVNNIRENAVNIVYTLSGDVSALKNLYFKYSKTPIEKDKNAKGADYSLKFNNDTGEFSQELSGLDEKTTYYYFCYGYVNGQTEPIYSKGLVESFTTASNKPYVESAKVESYNCYDATISYKIGGTIPAKAEYGIVYTDKAITNSDRSLQAGTIVKLENVSGKITLKNLTANKKYYYFLYVKYDSNKEPTYSNVDNFTTKSDVITANLKTPDADNVFYNSANLTFDFTGDPNLIEDAGLIYSTTEISKADISGSGTKISLGKTATSYKLQNLKGGTKYWAFVYVLSNGKYVYSPVISFTTLDKLLEITKFTTKDVRTHSAIFELQVKGDKNLAKEFGFVYSTDTITEKTHKIEDGSKMLVEKLNSLASPFTINKFVADQEYWCYCYVFVDEKNIFFTDIKTFKTVNKDPRPTEAIDLGLSVKWSPWNFGALKVEDYGGHYGWGDPVGENHSIIASEYGPRKVNGTICGTEYDIAHVNWGDGWRLPTKAEVEELFVKCKKTYAPNYHGSGVNGYIYEGPNGETIFMPYAGYRDGETYIWKDSYNTLCMWTGNTNELAKPWSAYERGGIDYSFGALRDSYYGMSIRPVKDKDPSEEPPVEPDDEDAAADKNPIDLGLPSGNLWSNYNLGAKNKSQIGTYYRWGEAEVPSNDATYYFTDYQYSDKEETSATGVVHRTYKTERGFYIEGTEYDAAHVAWKSSWQVPTESDCEELIDNCNVELVVENGVEYYKFTSKINKKTLYFPIGGHKADDKTLGISNKMSSYWTATLYDLVVGTHADDRDWANALRFFSTPEAVIIQVSPHYGCPIRPVKKPKK